MLISPGLQRTSCDPFPLESGARRRRDAHLPDAVHHVRQTRRRRWPWVGWAWLRQPDDRGAGSRLGYHTLPTAVAVSDAHSLRAWPGRDPELPGDERDLRV